MPILFTKESNTGFFQELENSINLIGARIEFLTEEKERFVQLKNDRAESALDELIQDWKKINIHLTTSLKEFEITDSFLTDLIFFNLNEIVTLTLVSKNKLIKEEIDLFTDISDRINDFIPQAWQDLIKETKKLIHNKSKPEFKEFIEAFLISKSIIATKVWIDLKLAELSVISNLEEHLNIFKKYNISTAQLNALDEIQSSLKTILPLIKTTLTKIENFEDVPSERVLNELRRLSFDLIVTSFDLINELKNKINKLEIKSQDQIKQEKELVRDNVLDSFMPVKHKPYEKKRPTKKPPAKIKPLKKPAAPPAIIVKNEVELDEIEQKETIEIKQIYEPKILSSPIPVLHETKFAPASIYRKLNSLFNGEKFTNFDRNEILEYLSNENQDSHIKNVRGSHVYYNINQEFFFGKSLEEIQDIKRELGLFATSHGKRGYGSNPGSKLTPQAIERLKKALKSINFTPEFVQAEKRPSFDR